MMQRLFIISDLHLGGAPAQGDQPSFQICGAVGQARLAEFIAWAAGQRTEARDVQLVLAGDIVDFLAERDADGGFRPFHDDEGAVLRKLDLILGRTQPIWGALRDLVAGGAALTMMLGNHDLELSLPAARRALLDRLGPGRVDFVYDNQALAIGPVLVEHGNRYDEWNGVSHDVLRQVRSSVSRGEAAPELTPPPGSRLVAQVMNHLKEHYSFVDLLKPEDSVLLPFIALLDRALWKDAKAVAALKIEASEREFDRARRPVDRAYIGARSEGVDEAMMKLADDIAAGGSVASVAAGDSAPTFRERWAELAAALVSAATEVQRAAARARRRAELGLLHRALRPLAEVNHRTFAVDVEAESYLQSVRSRAGGRFQLVVYGHTHLAKDIPATAAGVRYFNTGTWADLIRVPDAIFEVDSPEVREKLAEFAEAVANNRIDRFRRNVPTFAQIDLDGDRIAEADVRFFLDGGVTEPISTARLLELLDAEQTRG